jgi:hypothetical protein
LGSFLSGSTTSFVNHFPSATTGFYLRHHRLPSLPAAGQLTKLFIARHLAEAAAFDRNGRGILFKIIYEK